MVAINETIYNELHIFILFVQCFSEKSIELVEVLVCFDVIPANRIDGVS